MYIHNSDNMYVNNNYSLFVLVEIFTVVASNYLSSVANLESSKKIITAMTK